MGSRLTGWNLLQKDTKVCFFRNRQEEFQYFYSEENDLVYCGNICAVMDVLDHEQKTTEWRLFIDSSKTMKTVLLHNGNKFPSVPIAYASNMKETYENSKILLEKIQYDKYCWTICCNLKVIALLMVCSSAILNFVVSCANGTAGTRKIITSRRNGQSVNRLRLDRKMLYIPHQSTPT